MDLTLVLVSLAFIFLVYLWFRRTDGGCPPQPFRPLPIFGHLLSLDEDLRPQFKKWHKVLGPIFSLNLAGTVMVVLNGYDIIKEVMVKRADEFSDRPPFFVDKALGAPFKGIIFSNGQAWKEQRSVTLSILRAFGMGKNILAQMILDEVTHLLDLLATLDGRPVDMRLNMNMGMSNIICSFLLGHRFEYSDEKFQRFVMYMHSILSDVNSAQWVSFFPAFGWLPGDAFHAKRLALNCKKVMDVIVNDFIEKKKREGDSEDREAHNFVMQYLRERDRRLRDGQATTLDEEHLAKAMADLFMAGTDTTTTSLLWCMLYVINFPEAQEIIFQEINNEIGAERLPSPQDKTKLVYLNAFLAEVSRLASVAAHGFTHLCTNETTIKGYRIPKDSIIIPNLDSVMYDKEIWGNDVMSFRPERFIDKEGKLKIPEQLVPFGIGRRICLGEGFANTAIFLVMSSLIQRFKLLPKDNKNPPPFNYVFGPDVQPASFEVRFVDRLIQK